MKALAEYHDLTLGDLIEGIVLHAFEGKSAFGTENLKLIADLKNIYHLDLDASASHKLIERKPRRGKRDTVSSTGGRELAKKNSSPRSNQPRHRRVSTITPTICIQHAFTSP